MKATHQEADDLSRGDGVPVGVPEGELVPLLHQAEGEAVALGVRVGPEVVVVNVVLVAGEGDALSVAHADGYQAKGATLGGKKVFMKIHGSLSSETNFRHKSSNASTRKPRGNPPYLEERLLGIDRADLVAEARDDVGVHVGAHHRQLVALQTPDHVPRGHVPDPRPVHHAVGWRI